MNSLGWVVVIATCCGLLNCAEPETKDVLACHNSLHLACDQNQVVAAEIYTVAFNCRQLASGEDCACASKSRDCLTAPLARVTDIANCRWKSSSCNLHLDTFFTPCLVAKHFHCVKRTDVYDICAKSPGILTKSSGYVKSPGYPTVFDGGLRCSVSIRIPSAKSVYVRMISSHLPPRCGEGLDYLELATDTSDTQRVCGDVSYDVNRSWILSGDVANLTFVSRKTPKTYQGFVLYYEIIDTQQDSSEITLNNLVIEIQSASSSTFGSSVVFTLMTSLLLLIACYDVIH